MIGWDRSVLLVVAITLHNIPEGLAIGVAFGSTLLDQAAARSGKIFGYNVKPGA